MELSEYTSLYSIQSLKTMEIIDLNSGSKVGYIKDFKIDCNDYSILSIIIPSGKVSIFGKNNDIEIPWENVKKIGVDVILIDGSDFVIEDK
nr:YlmC/YmxH family sporulation protein [Clostridium acetireducens]